MAGHKMKKFIIILIVSTIANSLSAQSISGKILDNQNTPIEFVNVTLYSLPDSALITGTVTDQQGNFSLNDNLNGKKMYIKISFIGYKTQTVLSPGQGQTIILEQESTKLKDIVVTGNRKLFKLKDRSIVANVKNTILETLPNANEVIAQLPFLSGRDGNFTVFGKGKPDIYINNRLVRDTKELEQLSPSDIKTIQVITMPGSQYDASVKAVIKITTEKPAGEGLSGMVYVNGTQASVLSGAQYASLNYRTGAWDVFGSIYIKQHRYKTDFDATQSILIPNDTSRQIYKTYEKGGYNSIYPTVGVNFNPNKNHSAGVRYKYDYLRWNSDVENNIAYTGKNISEKIRQFSHFKNPDISNNINAYYNGSISEKTSLNINTDIITGHAKDNMNAHFEETPDILHTLGERNYRLYAAKGVLSHALGSGMLEAGGEYTYTRFSQTYFTNDPNLDIDDTKDKTVQNRGALFASYDVPIGKIEINCGIRYEKIDMDYFENEVKNKEQSRNYSKFFPNIMLSYSTEKVQIVTGYERKIYYPSYLQLRSNVQYSSPFLYESGNPLLQPKIENSFSAMFSWGDIQVMAEFCVNENDIYPVPQQYKNQPIILLKDTNIHHTKTGNFGISYAPTINIWHPRFEFGVARQWLDIETESAKYNKPVFNAKWFNTFSLPNKFTLGVNMSGNTHGHDGVTLIKSSWGIDLRLSKKLLDNRLTLNLSATDVFKTNTSALEMNYNKINFVHHKNIDSRSVSLRITYRFNTTTSKYKAQQTTDEIDRLK